MTRADLDALFATWAKRSCARPWSLDVRVEAINTIGLLIDALRESATERNTMVQGMADLTNLGWQLGSEGRKR